MQNAAHAPHRDEVADAVEIVHQNLRQYLETLDAKPARESGAGALARSFHAPLPEDGNGATATLRELVERGVGANVHTSGPRCFHFVIGGTTPAALGADLWTTVVDPIAYAWIVAPLAVELERLSIQWLAQLFELPHEHGVLTSGATMANFTCLAAARQWWGERHGRDVGRDGFGDLPAPPVFSSGYLHASSVKALGMLGMGRSCAQKFARDARGRLDLDALEAALAALDGAPAILIANAGEVNAGDFDPIDAMAELAERYGAWLHVDGAFGLFARVVPRTRHLTEGVERAHSVCVDGHKWLNVPYDCGFAFVRQAELLARAFVYDGAYLPDPNDAEPVIGAFAPESSRRARSLPVWATLRAYGRSGGRAMITRHLDQTQRLAQRVDEAPELERLAEAPLCIVCFRYRVDGWTDEALDALNARLGRAILEDGRYYAGATTFEGRTALRPALVNWRIRDEDVDGFVEVVRELGAREAARCQFDGNRVDGNRVDGDRVDGNGAD